jgi:hypothetical protein
LEKLDLHSPRGNAPEMKRSFNDPTQAKDGAFVVARSFVCLFSRENCFNHFFSLCIFGYVFIFSVSLAHVQARMGLLVVTVTLTTCP